MFLAPSALASPLRRQNSDTRKNNSAIYTGYISPCASGQPKALRFLDHWELALYKYCILLLLLLLLLLIYFFVRVLDDL